MEILGLFFEIIFLFLGIYVYRFATGKLRIHPTQQPFADRMRRENAGWMRVASLALIAIMSIEIILHIIQLLKK